MKIIVTVKIIVIIIIIIIMIMVIIIIIIIIIKIIIIIIIKNNWRAAGLELTSAPSRTIVTDGNCLTTRPAYLAGVVAIFVTLTRHNS